MGIIDCQTHRQLQDLSDGRQALPGAVVAHFQDVHGAARRIRHIDGEVMDRRVQQRRLRQPQQLQRSVGGHLLQGHALPGHRLQVKL